MASNWTLSHVHIDNECINMVQTNVLYICVYHCTISNDVIEMLIEYVQGIQVNACF
jgi:hypothetical protein